MKQANNVSNIKYHKSRMDFSIIRFRSYKNVVANGFRHQQVLAD